MKKLKIILCTLMISLIFIGNVNADSCTDCANAGTPCGRCGYSCAINDEGVCITNSNPADAQKKQDMGGCSGYTYEKSCNHNDYYSCIWNENKYGEDYCNTDKLQYVRCGDAFDIPHEVPQIFSLLVNLLKIATPIILIIVSIISLLKALSASSEDEIKKAQKSLIRKLIAAVMVFFIISIVQFVTMKVADNEEKSKINGDVETKNLSQCLTCFLNNDCENTLYYKTSVLGRYECTYVKTGKKFSKEEANKCIGNE